MGKGIIITNHGEGLYTITLDYDTSRVDAEKLRLEFEIDQLNDLINDVNNDIIGATDPDEITRLNRQKSAYLIKKAAKQRRIDTINKYKPNETKQYDVWCCDYALNLNNNIGTIEVPGELVNLNIQPGYNNNAVYDQDRDGQLQTTFCGTPASTFYNYAMMPGWQKWMPTFRYATLTNLSLDYCTITLDHVTSSAQGLYINAQTTYDLVSIKYMDCNGEAFQEKDRVVAEFLGQDFENPQVIGFIDHPRPCHTYLARVIFGGSCFIWDIRNGDFYSINDDNGDTAVYPALNSSIIDWLSDNSSNIFYPDNLYTYEYVYDDTPRAVGAGFPYTGNSAFFSACPDVPDRLYYNLGDYDVYKWHEGAKLTHNSTIFCDAHQKQEFGNGNFGPTEADSIYNTWKSYDCMLGLTYPETRISSNWNDGSGVVMKYYLMAWLKEYKQFNNYRFQISAFGTNMGTRIFYAPGGTGGYWQDAEFTRSVTPYVKAAGGKYVDTDNPFEQEVDENLIEAIENCWLHAAQNDAASLYQDGFSVTYYDIAGN